ncbi:dTDP-4-dehydrorhamnose 3,5-epimerase family protein [candidate division TA06 bacterium]|nr:dTDP-4-dehydrorhamnose 3,5-epimerase family protein [candidate division TA06 bacterium]
MIEGVKINKLKVISDERGFLMEILRSDDELFRQFGQLYLTVVYPGVVKGWHYHKKQTDHFCVVKGMVKVALYDQRSESRTYKELNEFFIGEKVGVVAESTPIRAATNTFVVDHLIACGVIGLRASPIRFFYEIEREGHR